MSCRPSRAMSHLLLLRSPYDNNKWDIKVKGWADAGAQASAAPTTSSSQASSKARSRHAL